MPTLPLGPVVSIHFPAGPDGEYPEIRQDQREPKTVVANTCLSGISYE